MSAAADFLSGGGELGELIRAKDWRATPLGEPASWPQSLKTCVRIVLTSRQPMFVWWGDELINLYNDAYKSIVGGKHPQCLGQPASVVWREIWHEVEPRVASSMRENVGTYDEALLLIMERNGYPEETYYTFSYSPVPSDDGRVGGLICANTDDTRRVIGERQLASLRRIAEVAIEARHAEDACYKIAGALGSNDRDLPFALIYLANANHDALTLAGSIGIDAGHAAAPPSLSLDSTHPWIAAGALQRSDLVQVELAHHFESVPRGFWQQPPQCAAVVPIAGAGQTRNDGLLVVGLNPHRLLDDDYRGFLSLVAGQISAAIASAGAFEQERQRAEALAEIDRAKTAFFSNVSHEFRTPLTLLMGPIEDVLQRSVPLDAATREDLSVARRNGLRLLKLVNTLLDFSRIEAGRVEASFEPTNLAEYTADLASAFRSAMDKAGLKFTVRMGPGIGFVYIDREMWEKIVLNLLSNAFKYTLHGEITVLLDASADRRYAELKVRDTGVGVPAAEMPKLFERFHRVEGQHGRTHEGSGIGLALVQELVKLHGGHVAVASEVGRGTTFTVSLPFGSDHLPQQRIKAGRIAASTALRADSFVQEALRWLPDETDIATTFDDADVGSHDIGAPFGEVPLVLLADDNADMRDYVRRLLTPGYEVQTVSNGREALVAMRKRLPDLLLTDAMMPELDGFALIKAIRAEATLRDVPVVMLSARAGEESKVEGLQSGADDYLVKPFSARELLARTSATLEISRTRKASTRAVREESRRFEILNRTGALVAAELDLEKVVQVATDAAVELTQAEFGAFFYNVVNPAGESYTLYTLSGVPREAFSKFPMPRNTAVFAPTFNGTGVKRSDDILKDPAYGHNAPHYGMPKGHLPVRSYLAVPVISRDGSVVGGLFFGHSKPGVFGENAEHLVTGIAAQAAIAIDNSRLYRESKHTAAELRQLNETLEQRVAAEINERLKVESTLYQAQKMDAIGQLTGGIAHDFNNLLTVVIGGIDGIVRRTKDGDADLHRRGSMALQAANRAAALTHRMLAFARRQPLEPKSTNLNKLISGMSELLRRTIDEKIAIETVLAGGLWWVSIDQNQLESALLNLAVNSRDAMSEGGRLTIETANAHLDEVYARAHEDLKPGQYVMLAVTDTGKGMTTDVVAKAFEPFFTTKEVGHGTGLGLSQVYGFVRQSGGHVKIYSEVGSGTTVKIYLPRLLASDVAETVDTLPPEDEIAGHGEWVLVVEDEPSVRAYSIDVLRELGYRTLDAPNGVVGLQVLELHPEIELLFTDVGLPGGLNGRQFADAALRLRPQLKILFTTGYARNAIVHQGRLDPGVELIVKPFTFSALGAKLRKVLEMK